MGEGGLKLRDLQALGGAMYSVGMTVNNTVLCICKLLRQ